MQTVIPGVGTKQPSTKAGDPFAAFSKFFRSKLEQIVSDPVPNEFRSDPILAQPLKSSAAVECWLNDRIGRDSLIQVCDNIDALLPDSKTQPAPYALQRRALYNLGIARNQLAELGLETAQIDRLYRGLFVYSHGILELLSSLNPEASKRIWKVYWTIVDISSEHKAKTAMSDVRTDLMLRLLEFHDRQMRMSSSTAQQKQSWQKEMKELTDLINNKDAIINQMEATISLLQQDADSLKQTMASNRLQNVDLIQQVGTWKSRLAQSMVDIDRLRRDKSETDALIGIVTLKKKKLEDQLADYDKKFLEMEFAERTLAQEKSRCERRATELLSALQLAQAAHRADLGRMNDLMHNRQVQDRIIAQLRTDLAETTRKLTLEGASREALEKEYSAAVQTVDGLTTDNAELRTKLTTATEQLRTRSTELDRARLELLALRELFEGQTAELKDITKTRDELAAQLNCSNAESRTTSTQLFCLREQLANMRRAWNDNCRRFAGEHRELMDARAKILLLKQGGDQQLQRIESLMLTVNEGKEQLKAIMGQHQREIDQLRYENQSVCVQRDEYVEMTMNLKATQEQLQQDVSNLQATITDKTSQIAKHLQSIEENAAVIQGLKIDLDVQMAKTATLEGRLNSVKTDLVEALETNVRLTNLHEDVKQTLLQSRNQCDQQRLAKETLRREMEQRIQQAVSEAEEGRLRSEKEMSELCESHKQIVADYENRLTNASEVEHELEKLLLSRVEQCKSLSRDLAEQAKSNRELTRRFEEQIRVLQQEKAQIEAESKSLQAANLDDKQSASEVTEKPRYSRDAILEYLQRDRTEPVKSVKTISIAIQTMTICDVELNTGAITTASVTPQLTSIEIQTDPVIFQDSLQSRRNSQSLASVHFRSPSTSSTAADVESFAAAVAPIAAAQLKMHAARLARKNRIRLPPVIAGRAGPSPAVAEAMAANSVFIMHDDDLSMTGSAFLSGRQH